MFFSQDAAAAAATISACSTSPEQRSLVSLLQPLRMAFITIDELYVQVRGYFVSEMSCLCLFLSVCAGLACVCYFFQTLVCRGVATNFRLGGTTPDRGGRIQVSQNHLPPNSDFSSVFAHFVWEILENPKVLANIPKIFFKNRDFWGDIPPGFSNRGGHVPRFPPGGAAHACLYIHAIFH